MPEGLPPEVRGKPVLSLILETTRAAGGFTTNELEQELPKHFDAMEVHGKPVTPTEIVWCHFLLKPNSVIESSKR
jgi:hypothetical protein